MQLHFTAYVVSSFILAWYQTRPRISIVHLQCYKSYFGLRMAYLLSSTVFILPVVKSYGKRHIWHQRATSYYTRPIPPLLSTNPASVVFRFSIAYASSPAGLVQQLSHHRELIPELFPQSHAAIIPCSQFFPQVHLVKLFHKISLVSILSTDFTGF